MKARRMLAAMAGGVSMFAFAAEEVPDTPGQTKVWATPGERGKRVEVDYFADAHYEGGVAPDFTKPSATNVTISLAATPTEAKRLQEIADGVSERYYGLVTLAHRFTDNTNTGTYLHALDGGPWTKFSLWWTSMGYALALTDPSSYEGWFDIIDKERGAYSTLYLQASEAFTPVVNRLSAMGAPNVKAPSGARAVVKEVFGPGLLNINRDCSAKTVLPVQSDGVVEVLNQPGPLTDVRVWRGTAALHGRPPDGDAAPAGAPALRLDAARVDTLATTADGEYVYVDEWRDADGRDVKAVKNADANRPRLDADAETRAPVVNFGSYTNNNGTSAHFSTLGPSGVLTLSKPIEGAREIHLVFRDQFRGSPMPQLVGCGSLSEWARDWLREDWNCLFSWDRFCDTPVYAGRTLFNNQTTLARAQPDTTRRLNVVASSLNGHAGVVKHLGAVAPAVWQGGAVLAEVIVYTNELTVAERLQTHRYLMRKWRPGERLFDYGAVVLGAGAALDVAGGTLAVRELILQDGAKTFVKRGAGTLLLSRITPADAQIRVEAGDVAFTPDYEPTAEPQPAADPTLHFDASCAAEDIETFEDADGKTRVAVWHDVRGRGWANADGDVYTLRSVAGVTNATVVAEPAGRTMVDLGPYAVLNDDKKVVNDATGLAFFRNGVVEKYNSDNSKASDQRHREGFLVYMKTDDRANALASQDWTVTKMASGAGDRFAHENYSFNRLIAGYWTYDGAWIDPHNAKNTKDEIHVVAFRGTRPLAVNAFGLDRGDVGQAGGVRIGEVIYYGRTLTSQERRDTELYLLRKWKGAAAHPQDACLAARSADVLYASGATATQDVAPGETVTARIRRAETLVKTGAGTLEAAVDPLILRALDARAGTLALAPALFLDADFHADAMDLASMQYTVDGAGNTNVTVWGGATALTSFWVTDGTASVSGTPRLPQRVGLDVNGTGRVLPFIDLGEQVRWKDAAERIPLGASMTWPDLGGLQEFHIVLKDKTTENPYNELIGFTQADYGGTKWPNAKVPFLRQDNDHILYSSGFSEALWNGYIGLDGEQVAPTTSFNNDVHLLTFAATSPVTNVFAFARRESYRIGGQLVGECVAFAATNTAARRAFIESHLRRKWLNADLPDETDELWDLDRIACANGAAVSFGASGKVRARALAGGGTLAFPAGGGLTGVSELAFAFRGRGDHDTMQINGTFAVAPAGTATVTLALADDVRPADLVGVHTLLAATAFENFGNFAGWTLRTAGKAPVNARAFLRAQADKGLVLEFVPVGTLLILR